MGRLDLDTPNHEDHVRDNVLNVGCTRCGRFIDGASMADWEEHRRRVMGPDRRELLRCGHGNRVVLEVPAGSVVTISSIELACGCGIKPQDRKPPPEVEVADDEIEA